MKNIIKIFILIGVMGYGLGVNAISSDVTFVQISAHNITHNSATLSTGDVDWDNSWVFEYSSNQALWSTAVPDDLPDVIGQKVNFAHLKDLLPNTTYYYRLYKPILVACVQAPCPASIPSYGKIHSFKTLSLDGNKNYGEVITKTLRYGMRGDEQIKTLQHLLNLKPDGIFGIKTKMAVIEMQKMYGLKPDGIVGPLTSQQIRITCCGPIID